MGSDRLILETPCEHGWVHRHTFLYGQDPPTRVDCSGGSRREVTLIPVGKWRKHDGDRRQWETYYVLREASNGK